MPEKISRPETEPRNYDLKPTSRICQRPALIKFDGLVRYLMDLGALPEYKAWKHLFDEELQVSQGTVLLRTRPPRNSDAPSTMGLPVLVIRKQDEEEDDHLLAMLLSWEGVTTLSSRSSSNSANSGSATVAIRHILQPREGEDQIPADQICTIMVEIGRDGIKKAHWKGQGNGARTLIPVGHLANESWFNSVVTIIGAQQGTTTAYFVPNPLFEFARSSFDSDPAIPCGVLQHCGLVSAKSCLPEWKPQNARDIAFEPDDSGHIRRDVFERPTIDGVPDEIIDELEKNRVSHASSSLKWTVMTIANEMRQYLLDHYLDHYLIPSRNVGDGDRNEVGAWHIIIAESIMYRLILKPDEAVEVRECLSRWQSTWKAKGPDGVQVQWIAKHKHAVYLLYVLGQYAVLHHPYEGDTYKLVEECLNSFMNKDVLLY